MKKYYIVCFFIFILVSLSPLHAQQIRTLKGIAIDSTSKNALKFATITLKTDSAQIVKTILTNDRGMFSFNNINEGNYLLSIVYLGYLPNTLPLQLSLKDSEVDLGEIKLSKATTELGEVIVSGQLPLIKEDIDRLVYNVQADPEIASLSTLELMRKVPLLSVDGNDNLRLQGNGNYRIFINNRPSAAFVRNPATALKAMPASSIEKIEVITTPPAKYDSEGLTGIINIVTIKNTGNDYNGSLNADYRTPAGGPNLAGTLTAKKEKFGLSLFTGSQYAKKPTTQNNFNQETLGENPISLHQKGLSERESLYSYIGAQLGYDIDSLNLVNIQLGGNIENRDLYLNRSTVITAGSSSTLERYLLNTKDHNHWDNFTAGFNYQKGFKRNKEQLLTLSYLFERNSEKQRNQMRLAEQLNFDLPDYNQDNLFAQDDHTVQLDYVHPAKKLVIEWGLKGIFRLAHSDFRTDVFNKNSEAFIEDRNQSNGFINDQYITGIYNSYRYQWKQWGLAAGLRAEHTTVKADFLVDGAKIGQQYFNVIPSLSINRMLKSGKNVNFGYTQRVQRPYIRMLNPFVDRSNPSFEYTGNPELRSVLSNMFNLRYSSYKKAAISMGLNYLFANRTIQQVLLFNENTKTSRFTYENIGKGKNLGLSLSLSYPLAKRLAATLNGNMNYSWIEGTVEGNNFDNSGLQGYLYSGLNYQFDKGWRLNGNFSYNSPVLTLQGKNNSFPNYGLSASKELVKNRLSFSASMANLFSKYQNSKSFLNGSDFTQSSLTQNYYRSASINLLYRFGKLKEEIRKNRKGIVNDDLVKGK